MNEYDNSSVGASSAFGNFGKNFLISDKTASDEGAPGKRTSEERNGAEISSNYNGFSFDDENRVNINLRKASIDSASRLVIGDILKKSYVISPGVSGNVTIQTTNSISVAALLDTFGAVLAFNGAGLVVRDDVVYIEPLNSLSSLPLKIRTKSLQRGTGLGQAINIVPLDFVAAAQIAELLKPLIGDDKVVYVDERQNLIFIAGNPREVDTALEAINLFDVDVMKGQSFALIPVKNAEPEVIVKELETIFATKEGDALAGLVKFVPNNRLASILAISSRSHYLSEAREWVERLDRAAAGANQRLFVYSVQNREAEDLAKLLQGILTENAGSRDNYVVSEQKSNIGLSDRIDATFTAAASDGRSNQTSKTRGTASFDIGRLRVVADSGNNAILVYATQSEYESVLPMIRQLDSLPNQVLLEATIAEVTLTDELNFGLRWYFENGNFAFKLSDLASGAAAASNPGFSFLFSAGDTKVALNALSSITDVNIISSPNLLVLDNRKAVLQIGDQVPIATEAAVDTSSDQTVVNSIELKDTGIILTVTPRVNDSGRVILDISQEVSDVVPTTTSGIDSPTIRQRKVTTTVVVNDGDSLALGGLIQQHKGVTKSQVPLLGDVPVVGNLFKHKEDTEKRTELLILVTPHVIRDLREANSVTEEFRKQLGGLRVLGDKSDDSLKHRVNRIFK